MQKHVLLSVFLAGAAMVTAATTAAAPAGPPPGAAPTYWSWAQRPIMGWNSWDCFGAGVNEEQTLANAAYMKEKLLAHGYNLITVDIQWYEPLAHSDVYRRNAALEMDENGRLLPAGNRFPLTKEARSFKPLADKLHGMGLKFGLHLMRGIPRQAVDKDVPILGTEKLKEGGIHASDIASKTDICNWNTDMYGVDMTKAGAQEYYNSVLALLASWEIDFLKVDDLSAPRYHTAEVEAIRKAIDKTGRAIVLSTSPGATPLNQGEHVQMHANQWRVSNDFWDSWGALQSQFARLDNWTPFRGPGHFPDADMLPVGSVRTWNENDNKTHFTHDELYTLMNLWCIARSPLIIGADMPANDAFTLEVLTNDEVLQVNQYSMNNRQLSHVGNLYVWVADAEETGGAGGAGDKYVALFNAPPAPPGRGRRGGAPAATAPAEVSEVRVTAAELGFKNFATVRDLWGHKDLVLKDNMVLGAMLMPHGSAMFKVSGGK